MKISHLIAGVLSVAAVGCAADPAASSIPGPEIAGAAQKQTLQASEITRNTYQITSWVTEKVGDGALVYGTDADNNTRAKFQLRSSPTKNEGGFEVVGVLPEQGTQERDRRAAVVHNGLTPLQSEMFESFLSDQMSAVASPSPSSSFAQKDDACSICGAGGTDSKCYGVVLICQDLDICGDNRPDNVHACGNDYLCGACLGLPF